MGEVAAPEKPAGESGKRCAKCGACAQVCPQHLDITENVMVYPGSGLELSVFDRKNINFK